jgi:hypothetical protein
VRIIGIIAASLLLEVLTCNAQEGKGMPAVTSTTAASRWAYSVTASYYSFHNQDDFFLGVATAEKGPLHIEARYNYEAIDSGSLFAGWKFSGGEKITYELTPILGVVFGSKEGIAPGFEASISYGIVDFYTETEYVHDLDVREDSFTYSWNELGFSPLEWLRFGLASQRTLIYQSDRDIQRGFFAQVKYRKATFGIFDFNPDDSCSHFIIYSLGFEF